MTTRFALAAAAALALSAGHAAAQAPGAPLPKTPGATAAQPPSTSPLPSTPSTGLPSTGLPSTSPSTSAPASDTAVTPPPAKADEEAAPSAAASGSNVSVTTGMDVKDNTGAKIGTISEVKAGADGKKTATIKMGADTFAVDTTSLAVAGGAATVNASQSEIKSMLAKKSAPKK